MVISHHSEVSVNRDPRCRGAVGELGVNLDVIVDGDDLLFRLDSRKYAGRNKGVNGNLGVIEDFVLVKSESKTPGSGR